LSFLPGASYWLDLGERTIRAFFQGFLAAAALKGAGAAVPGVIGITDFPWLGALNFGIGTAMMAVLTGLSTISLGDRKTATFLPPPDKSPQVMRAVFHRDHSNDAD
jgi:hypothetical protein